jgi:6-phosphogluconate dehydrogenase (decarboxylating)
MIGLGRMGANMVRRLLKAGHEKAGHDGVVFDVSPKAGESGWRLLAGRSRQKTREAAGALVDGSGGGCGQNHC